MIKTKQNKTKHKAHSPWTCHQRASPRQLTHLPCLEISFCGLPRASLAHTSLCYSSAYGGSAAVCE